MNVYAKEIESLLKRINEVDKYSPDSAFNLRNLFTEYREITGNLYQLDPHVYNVNGEYLNDLIDKADLMIDGKSFITRERNFNELKSWILFHLNKILENH